MTKYLAALTQKKNKTSIYEDIVTETEIRGVFI